MKKEFCILSIFCLAFALALVLLNHQLQNTPTAIVKNNISLIAKNYDDPSRFYTDNFLTKIYGNELVAKANKNEKNELFKEFMKSLTSESYGFPHVTGNENYEIRFLIPSLPNYYLTLVQIEKEEILAFDDVKGDVSHILESTLKED